MRFGQRRARNSARRKVFVSILKIVKCNSNLTQVVRALRPAGRFTSRLNRWQQQRNQHANDGNHYKQLYQRECWATVGMNEGHVPLLEDSADFGEFLRSAVELHEMKIA
jgi:hypothetical protein